MTEIHFTPLLTVKTVNKTQKQIAKITSVPTLVSLMAQGIGEFENLEPQKARGFASDKEVRKAWAALMSANLNFEQLCAAYNVWNRKTAQYGLQKNVQMLLISSAIERWIEISKQ